MAVEKLTFEMNAVGNAVPEMKKVQTQLAGVNSTMEKATAVTKRYGAASRMAVSPMRGMTRNLGLASLQFQDMAVQASMGTDALRIMTMQAPQLASIFGPAGMIVGGLIAVGGAIALMGDNTKKTSFDFKQLAEDIGLMDFGKSALEKLKPVLNFVKNLAIGTVNAFINGWRFTFKVIEGGRAVFRRFADVVELNFSKVVLKMKVMKLEAQATFQSIKDMFGGEAIGENGFGIAEQLRFEADAARSQVGLINRQLESMASAKDAFMGVFDDFEKTDIRDYFSQTAKEVEKAAGAVSDKLTPAMERAKSAGESVGASFETAFMEVFKGTKSAGEAFRSMAMDIIAELYRIFVVKRITGFIEGAVTGFFNNVGANSASGLTGKAIGGPVQAGSPYMVGERGPELFVPSRTGSIVSNDKLGGGGLVVHQTVNISTGVQQTVRNEIQTLLPQIAEASKAAVLEARRRGGSFANAF